MIRNIKESTSNILRFPGAWKLTSVTLSDSMTSIRRYAFYGCKKLTSVTIPNSVTTIEDHAFYGCIGLTSVTIPDSVTTIENHAFYNCTGLTSVTLPDSVTTIDDYAFAGCTGLTTVIIPNSVTNIGCYAFKGCTGLTTVSIPDSVASIGRYAFYGCTGLTKAAFTSIESLCAIYFKNWSANPLSYVKHLYMDGKEVTNLVIPESVTRINGRTFYGCTELTTVTIPDSVTNIGNGVFSNCTGLTSVTIPGSVTRIESCAFYGCTGLTSVSIPASVTRIGSEAFSGCTGLTKAEFASIESLCSIQFINGTSNPLNQAKHLYIDGKEVTDLVIPESVTRISGKAFHGCTGLTSVTIPDSVTTIEDYAFSGCTGLMKAEFASIESLCSIKFSNRSANPLWHAKHLYIGGKEVTELTIPNTVTSIGDYAFYGCTGLTSVTIPNSVTTIGGDAFSGCTGLTSLYVGWNRPLNVSNDIADSETYKRCALYVPTGRSDVYMTSPIWINFTNILEYDTGSGPIYITIMHGGMPVMKQKVASGTQLELLIPDGFTRVAFNGEDVTGRVADGKFVTPAITDNATLSVEFETSFLDSNNDGKVDSQDVLNVYDYMKEH